MGCRQSPPPGWAEGGSRNGSDPTGPRVGAPEVISPRLNAGTAWILFLVLAGCATLPEAGRLPAEWSSTRVEGKVSWQAQAGAEALPGVHVAMWAPRANPDDPTAVPLVVAGTDAAGAFLLSVPVGWEGREVVLEFRHPGYARQRLPRSLPAQAGASEALDVVMAPSPGGGPANPLVREPGYSPRTRPGTPEARGSGSPWSELTVAGPSGLQAAPLAATAANGLHYLLLVPPPEGLDLLTPGHWAWALRADAAQEDLTQAQAGTTVRIDGRYSQTSLGARVGLAPGWELRAWLPMAGREGTFDISNLDEAERASTVSTGDAVVGLKSRFLAFAHGSAAFTWSAHVKLPTGRVSEVLSTGGADVASSLGLHGRLGPGWLHAQAGFVLTGKQRLFLEQEVLDNMVTGSLGYAVPAGAGAVLVQVQGNTNAYKPLGMGDEAPIVLYAGFRARVWGPVLEAGLGTGLNDAASQVTGTVALVLGF